MTHIIEEYPKIVFKTRTDHRTVNDLEQEESALHDGYGEYEVVILKKKPHAVVEAEKREAMKTELRKELEKEMAEKSKAAPELKKPQEAEKSEADKSKAK